MLSRGKADQRREIKRTVMVATTVTVSIRKLLRDKREVVQSRGRDGRRDYFISWPCRQNLRDSRLC